MVPLESSRWATGNWYTLLHEPYTDRAQQNPSAPGFHDLEQEPCSRTVVNLGSRGMLKLPPSGPQELPKRAQDAAKRPSRGLQQAPKCSQENPNRANEAFNHFDGTMINLNGTPEWPQDRPKTSQDSFKTAQEGARRPPKNSYQMGPSEASCWASKKWCIFQNEPYPYMPWKTLLPESAASSGGCAIICNIIVFCW